MNSQDLSLGPVEMRGAFTKRKEKRVNADTYQQGWIEWKTKSSGRKACRFRYWVRDESKPGEWRKAATPWEEGLTEKQAKRRLRDLMTAMELEAPKLPPVVVAEKGLTLKEFVESHWQNYQTNRGIKASTRGSNAATLKNHILPALGSRILIEITPTYISNFFRGLADKHLSTKSVLNVYQLLHVMFEVAAGTRSRRKQSRTAEVASTTTQAQEDADLECGECSEDSSRSAGALESFILVHCFNRCSCWRIVGAPVERH